MRRARRRDLPVPEALEYSVKRRMNALASLMRLPTQMFSGSQFKGLAAPLLIVMILA